LPNCFDDWGPEQSGPFFLTRKAYSLTVTVRFTLLVNLFHGFLRDPCGAIVLQNAQSKGLTAELNTLSAPARLPIVATQPILQETKSDRGHVPVREAAAVRPRQGR
jgi:hypothetical protein